MNADHYLFSNPSPLQRQEPLPPPLRPRSSLPLAVSTLFTLDVPYLRVASLVSVTSHASNPSKDLKAASKGKTNSENILVPEIVIGNQTVTPTANPIGLSIFNGTFTGHPVTASTGGVAFPTGGNFTTTPQIFSGTATWVRADAWLAIWATGFLGLGAFVYYL